MSKPDLSRIYPLADAIALLQAGRIVPFWVELMIARVGSGALEAIDNAAFKLGHLTSPAHVLLSFGLDQRCEIGAIDEHGIELRLDQPGVFYFVWPRADRGDWRSYPGTTTLDRIALAILPGAFDLVNNGQTLQLREGELLEVGLSPHICKGTKLADHPELEQRLTAWARNLKVESSGDRFLPPAAHLAIHMFDDAVLEQPKPEPTIDELMLDALNRNTAALERVAELLEHQPVFIP